MRYPEMYYNGSLERLIDELTGKLSCCVLCPRKCRVNRLKNEGGFCQTKRRAKVSGSFLHFGEEPELVGRGGSGTIFFSYCNLGCLYCQNYAIAHLGEGREAAPEELAAMMVALQNKGAENINFVTPTHAVTAILEGLAIAVKKGLTLPLVYNCGGYENRETLKLLEGVFDIYMPDLKYSDNDIAEKFSSAPDYWEVAKEAVKEMHRQVGDLLIEEGRAKRGLLVRHLILPGNSGGAFKILDFIKEEVSPHTYVNLMPQYRPFCRAGEFKELSRRITEEEYLGVKEYAREKGFLPRF